MSTSTSDRFAVPASDDQLTRVAEAMATRGFEVRQVPGLLDHANLRAGDALGELPRIGGSDDPVGIVHIRDLVTFMIKQAAVSAVGRRRKPPAGLDFKAVDLAMPLSSAKIVPFSPRSSI